MSDPDNDWVPTLAPIPDPDSPAGQLAQELRELARTSKTKSLRDFAKLTHYSATRISEALSGKPRSVSEEGIKTICEACNADEPTRARLREMRAQAINSRAPARSLADPPAPAPVQHPVDPSPPDLTPPVPSASPGPARWKWWRVAVLVAVLAVGVIIVWSWWPNGCGVFSGMRLNDKTDGECIGITDGSYLFNDPDKATNPDDRNVIERINDIERRVETENNAVAGTDYYVKVVLLTPLTVSQDKDTLSAMSLKEILHCLEGSYTALYRANHSRDFGDPSAMKIQLLLANQGSQQDADPDFLNDIVKESEPAHPVVAVIGLGSSLPTTMTAVDYIAKQNIPLVGAVASADSLTNLHLLWSVSPSNDQYVQALNAFLGTRQGNDVLKSGIIVYDQNPDPFTQSLARDYRNEFGKSYVMFPEGQGFRGGTERNPAQPDVFVPVATNLCTAVDNPITPLDMVFYAGRVADLGAFTEALKDRTCRNRPLTVLTATTGFAGLQDSVQGTLPGSNVTVVVATASDSASWGKNEASAPPGYPAFLAAYQARGFSDDPNSIDGYTIGYHDTLAVAAQAIRLAAQGRPTQAPTPEDVAIQLGNLNLSSTVTAASGTLSFGLQNGGRATGQSIQIRQIR